MTLIPSFRQQKSMLAQSQRACYKALVRAVGPKPVVLARVNLADLVQHPGHDARYGAHWHLIRRHWVDFVVCSPNSMCPVIAIQLETQLDKRKREHGLDVVANTLASTRIRLLRLPAADNYDDAEVRQRIRRALENRDRNAVGPTKPGGEHVKSLNEDTAEPVGRSTAVHESVTRSKPDVANRKQVVVRRGSSHTLPS